MPSRPANASILRARQTSYGCLYRVYIESSVPGKQVASTESDYIDDPSRSLKRFSAPPWIDFIRKDAKVRKDFFSYYRSGNKWLKIICRNNVDSFDYPLSY